MLPYGDSRLTKIVLAVFFVVIVCYAFYEAFGILAGPSIQISGRAMLVYEPYIEIKGTAQRIASLTMNGAPIAVTEDGSFDQPYVLSPGYNRIALDAKDKYGKTAERVIEIVYEASSTSATSTPTNVATSTKNASTTPVAQ
jgi:uncharacterized protein YfaP (DUF2135 family)